MQTNYVVGFMFDADMRNVALIRKQKPKWQAGLLNGIGGKVEDEESAFNAMRREFSEEASYPAPSEIEWLHFCSMSGTNNDGSSFGIDFYYSFGTPSWLISNEAEQIEVINAGAIVAGDWKTVGNVPWLVALAIDFGKGVHPPTTVEVRYAPKAVAA